MGGDSFLGFLFIIILYLLLGASAIFASVLFILCGIIVVSFYEAIYNLGFYIGAKISHYKKSLIKNKLEKKNASQKYWRDLGY